MIDRSIKEECPSQVALQGRGYRFFNKRARLNEKENKKKAQRSQNFFRKRKKAERGPALKCRRNANPLNTQRGSIALRLTKRFFRPNHAKREVKQGD